MKLIRYKDNGEDCYEEVMEAYEVKCQNCGIIVDRDDAIRCDFCNKDYCPQCFYDEDSKQRHGENVLNTGYNVCFSCAEENMVQLVILELWAANVYEKYSPNKDRELAEAFDRARKVVKNG